MRPFSKVVLLYSILADLISKFLYLWIISKKKYRRCKQDMKYISFLFFNFKILKGAYNIQLNSLIVLPIYT
jgi:hypothetical protein